MIPHDPHSYADLQQGKIAHIDLRIQADFEAHILKIEADYRLAEPVSGSLFLDTAGIELLKAVAEGKELRWEFDQQDELLGERLHLKELNGASSFSLVFNTSNAARALQWLPAVQTASGEHPFLYSQCQAIHARSIFPCQDTPSVRFTFSAEMEVPRALTAVMAAEQVGVSESGESHVFQFKMPQPIPSYLFAIGAGNWSSVNWGRARGSTPSRNWSKPPPGSLPRTKPKSSRRKSCWDRTCGADTIC
jgi:leukotriene-A4 hydrolase